jgi:hypothetical protein
MLDFAGYAAQEYSRAIAAEHEHEARRSVWRMRLRDLLRQERATKDKPAPVRAAKPQPLTGAHSPWI